MKPCRSCRPMTGPSVQNTVQNPIQNSEVNRYSHPILTRNRNREASGSVEELLAGILEKLSQHSDLLEELLRRTEKSDTM